MGLGCPEFLVLLSNQLGQLGQFAPEMIGAESINRIENLILTNG